MLILDGVELKSIPATLVMLDCGDVTVVDGHDVQEGDEVQCPTDCDWHNVHGSRADRLVRTSVIPAISA